jgi:pantoate--beta-alanine ligase
MSSRNIYLSAEERQRAAPLYRAMTESAQRIRTGEAIALAMAGGAGMIEKAGFALDYFEARHAETLVPVTSSKAWPLRILVAARLGTTRLIDNIPVWGA